MLFRLVSLCESIGYLNYEAEGDESVAFCPASEDLSSSSWEKAAADSGRAKK